MRVPRITENTTDGIIHQPIDINDFTVLECRSFAKMLRTGEMDFTYEELIRPVFVLAAIEKSYQTGKLEPIPTFEL